MVATKIRHHLQPYGLLLLVHLLHCGHGCETCERRRWLSSSSRTWGVSHWPRGQCQTCGAGASVEEAEPKGLVQGGARPPTRCKEERQQHNNVRNGRHPRIWTVSTTVGRAVLPSEGARNSTAYCFVGNGRILFVLAEICLAGGSSAAQQASRWTPVSSNQFQRSSRHCGGCVKWRDRHSFSF